MLTDVDDQILGCQLELLPNVREHDVLCDLVENDLRAGREERESALDVPLELVARESGEGAELQVEAELLVLKSDKIQHRENCLVVGPAEAPPQLLEEDRR